MEVPAPFAGIVQNLLIEPSQKIEIGQAILEYEDKKGGNAKSTPKPEAKQKTATQVHAPSPVRRQWRRDNDDVGQGRSIRFASWPASSA